MEVTALKGSSGDRAALRRSYFRRAWRPLWPRGNDPTSAKTKRRSKAYLTIETPAVACPFRVQLRRTQCGRMFSALLSNSDIARCCGAIRSDRSWRILSKPEFASENGGTSKSAKGQSRRLLARPWWVGLWLSDGNGWEIMPFVFVRSPRTAPSARRSA
jgi:hypothetical protein